MKRIQRSTELPFGARQMYDLVNDVAAYPEFLPWCGAVQIHERTETRQRATLELVRNGLRKSFTTINTMVPGERIEVMLDKGPFRRLHGDWQFRSLGEQRCRIDFRMEFEFAGALLDMALGPLFTQVTETMVESFRRRAYDVYGQGDDSH